MKLTLAVLSALVCVWAAMAWTAPDNTPVPEHVEPAAPPETQDLLADQRQPQSQLGPVTPAAVARANLIALLRQWQPATGSQRARLAERAGERIDELGPPLLEILDETDFGLLVAAIELTAALRFGDAAATVQRLAERQSATAVRVAAIRALAALDAWQDDVHVVLLRAADPNVVEAALAACSTRAQPPVRTILDLLQHPLPAIRHASAAALPALTADDLDSLCRLVQHTDAAVVESAVIALGASVDDAMAESTLYECLDHASWRVRRAALRSLARKTSTLADPERLIAFVSDPEVSPREKAVALIAFEHTRTVPVAKIEAMLPDLHPVLGVLAARCLVTAGRRSALPALLELLETQRSPDGDREDSDYANEQAHRILIELAGHDFGPRAEAWKAWVRGNHDLTPRILVSPPLEAW
jgi:hypothetical protein